MKGWKNYETWNVALWAANDEGIYRSILEERRTMTRRWSGPSARRFFESLLPEGTPDFASIGGRKAYSRVDWVGIGIAFEEMSS